MSGMMELYDDAREPSRSARLLTKVQADPALPALGSAVVQVVQIASGDDDAVQKLSHFILSDVSLTQKVLSAANTVEYRTQSRPQVTTVSRAIFLLGFDAVKTIALAMLLVEGLTGAAAQLARQELQQALAASLTGRELAKRSGRRDGEEAAIVALFKNFGRLLVAVHDPRGYQEIMTQSAEADPSAVAVRVLGCGFETLAEAVLRDWQIPGTIIQALAPLPSGVLRRPAGEQEWLQQVGGFSAELASRLFSGKPGDLAVRQRQLLSRYGAALQLDARALDDLARHVAQEATALAYSIDPAGLAAPQGEGGATAAETTDLHEFLLMPHASEEAEPQPEPERYPSGKPLHANDLLLAGVQDITEALAGGKLSREALMMLLAEVLLGAMGFRFVAVCVKQPGVQQFHAQVAVGQNSMARRNGFVLPVAGGNDLFHLAMQNNVDITISDASQPNVRALLPGTCAELTAGALSLVILPLILGGRPFGFVYADRALEAPEGVSAGEAALMKTLKAQLLARLT